MPVPRCAYFSLAAAHIAVLGLHQAMRMPICRCALVEEFVDRLRDSPRGHDLVRVMEGDPIEGHRRPLIGCDFQPISAPLCTHFRQEQCCIPAFLDILNAFEMDATIPPPAAPE